MAFDADNKWVDIRLMAIVIIDELIIDSMVIDGDEMMDKRSTWKVSC